MSDNMKLVTPDDMRDIYRGKKTRITATRIPGISVKNITGRVFPKGMHDFLKTMQAAANWYVYAIAKPLEPTTDDDAKKNNLKTEQLATLSNCLPEFNRWHCALVLKPGYIDRYFVMCSDQASLGILESMFGMDQDGDSIIILKEETVSDSDVLTITEGETSEQRKPKGDLDKLLKYHGHVAEDLTGGVTIMFKEVHTLEDLKYVHFVVLIFRDADQCGKYCIYLEKMKLSLNKQYWALVTDVNKADEIHTKDGFHVSFKGDNNCMHQLWIPCNLCENGLTAYTFRTPDEEMTLLNYKAAKIADILERTVLKYNDHPRRSEDERFQTNLERTVDEKYIRELCQEEGLYDPDNHDTLDIEWLHWIPGHQYRVHYNEHGNGVSFNVNIGGQILGSSE